MKHTTNVRGHLRKSKRGTVKPVRQHQRTSTSTYQFWHKTGILTYRVGNATGTKEEADELAKKIDGYALDTDRISASYPTIETLKNRIEKRQRNRFTWYS
jgi:hypothetical protein